jgi:SAM-dependent methyltransferase
MAISSLPPTRVCTGSPGSPDRFVTEGGQLYYAEGLAKRPGVTVSVMSRSDPTSFRSGLLPTEHFDQRFSQENLAFWAPLLIDRGRISADTEVLDVGCGTGGFAREIARLTSARVTGLDEAEQFIDFARTTPDDDPGAVGWVVGDADELPFPASSFDRVLLSLVLHQLARPASAVDEAFRVLRPGGLVLVRTIAPDDARDRVPERYIPSMAAADAARLPALETITEWLRRAGFADITISRHLRNKVLDLDDEETALQAEVQGRYPFVPADELEDGVRRMREDAERARGTWIDPRPTYIIVSAKPS